MICKVSYVQKITTVTSMAKSSAQRKLNFFQPFIHPEECTICEGKAVKSDEDDHLFTPQGQISAEEAFREQKTSIARYTQVNEVPIYSLKTVKIFSNSFDPLQRLNQYLVCRKMMLKNHWKS